jgi:titin
MRSRLRFGRDASVRARQLVRWAIAAAAIGACDGSNPTQPTVPGPEAAVNAVGAPFPVEFFVQAHQDDWQLFLGNRAAEAVPTASKIVFVYTTAGDAGDMTSGYWQARELAAQTSIDSMTPAGPWSCGNQTVNGHVIHRCTKGSNIVTYDLRLPDGNGEGQGYSGRGSLARLRSGAISSFTAVNASTTYTSWGDLVSTFRSIVTFEAAGRTDPVLAIHAPDDDREVNGSDHSDHLTTGDLVRTASVGRPWNLFWYMGYQNLFEPVNLTQAQYLIKWKLIVAYDTPLKGNYGTIIGTSHSEEWARRTVFRTQWTTGEPPPPPTTVPVAPTALVAVPVGGTRIDLTWTDNATDEDGFRIERAPDVAGVAGTYVEVGTVAASVGAYSSTDVVGNTSYWFRVRAYNVVGPSGYSNATSAILTGPAAPTALAAIPFSATRIDLTWVDNSSDEQGFRIERAPDVAGAAGTFAEIATVGAGVRVYTSTGLQSNTRYWYRVRAYNAVGPSTYSNEINATTPVPPASTFPTEVYLVAHQDDWQLFLGNRVASSAQTATKVVLVYTTAGDGGDLTSGYWQARETATNASVDSMTVAGAWTCANQTVNAHVIRRCAKANTVSYYMRLPDGNSAGQGYGAGSLNLLRAGSISSLAAVNGSTTYASWGDLVSTVRALVVLETTGLADANIGVHALEWDPVINEGDHPDHMTTGQLAREASVTRAWNMFWYMGYPTLNLPPNLGPAEQAIKWEMIVAYDDVLKGDYGTIIGTSHAEEWSERTIYRTELSSGIIQPVGVPVAPTSLATVNYQGTRIDLTWLDNAGDEQGYRVERAPDVGGVAGAFAQIASVGANVKTYSNTGLVINTPYWYRVRAYNAIGTSAYSNVSSAVVASPTAPSALVATPVTGVRIDLAWTDNSGTEEQGFRVERAPDVGGAPGAYTQIASVAANIRIYSNTGLTVTTRYWYRVRAYNAVGTSAYTSEVAASTLSPPAAPSALTATAITGVRIDLAWTDNANDEQGFRVERAPDVGGVPGTFALITSPGANVRTYSNTGLANGTRYWYRVRAYNTVGNSAYTNDANATTLAPPAVPTNVQGVSVTSTTIDLSWTDNASDEASFRLERAPDVAGAPGTFGSAVTLGANVTTYRVSALAVTTSYWFRIRAQNTIGNSAFSTPVRVTTIAVVPPSDLAASAYLVGTTRNVDLTWTRGSEPTVDIFRNGTRIVSARANDGGPYNNKPAVSLGATISYQVCAAGKTGAANCSAVVSVTF